jgi:hypothetical protein
LLPFTSDRFRAPLHCPRKRILIETARVLVEKLTRDDDLLFKKNPKTEKKNGPEATEHVSPEQLRSSLGEADNSWNKASFFFLLPLPLNYHETIPIA